MQEVDCYTFGYWIFVQVVGALIMSTLAKKMALLEARYKTHFNTIRNDPAYQARLQSRIEEERRQQSEEAARQFRATQRDRFHWIESEYEHRDRKAH